MSTTYRYFVNLTPFRVLIKYSARTLLISNKGDYVKIHSALLSKFKEGDYIFESKMIGNGFVNTAYVKNNQNKIGNSFFRIGLENIFLIKN